MSSVEIDITEEYNRHNDINVMINEIIYLKKQASYIISSQQNIEKVWFQNKIPKSIDRFICTILDNTLPLNMKIFQELSDLFNDYQKTQLLIRRRRFELYQILSRIATLKQSHDDPRFLVYKDDYSRWISLSHTLPQKRLIHDLVEDLLKK